MSRIEGPSRGQPPPKPDGVGGKPAEEGEFDRVLVLEDGQSVEEGRYEELVAQQGNGLARLVA